MSDDLTDSWPPRWKPGVHFKKPILLKVERHVKTTKRSGRERKKKDACRDRDMYCRFPLCGCGKHKLPLESAHLQHKGMGGNPKEDRSAPEKLITLCNARHRRLAISMHAGTLRVTPLTNAGSAGPCSYLVDLPTSFDAIREGRRRWVEVGRETARHVFEPFTVEQTRILKHLAEMTL